MERVLLDTNIYGLIAVDKDRLKITDSIIKSGLIVYGTGLNRKELRAVPKYVIVAGRNLRVDLLNLFDGVVGNHIYEINQEMEKIANNYYKVYSEFGGSKPESDLINDFIIVACAALHNLDIIVSNDEKSMLSENALRAYKLINSIMKRRTPRFIDYIKFKKILRGGMSNEFV